MYVKILYNPSSGPIKIFSDDDACVFQSKSSTVKGIHYMTIRENITRESSLNKTVSMNYIEGKVNLADIFAKEIKDDDHSLSMMKFVTCIAPPILCST